MADSNRKKQILKGAARLFRKRGFTATSMRDIASELQIEAPSLYNHIKGKQEILQILLLELARSFTLGMEVIISSTLTYEEQLEGLIRLHVDLTIKHPNKIFKHKYIFICSFRVQLIYARSTMYNYIVMVCFKILFHFILV